MPAWALRREAAALLGFVSVALVFAWPLPLRFADALLGLPNGDAGVYVWNLWVFRHEIVANHRLPFLTSEILALSPPVPLALHNYTTFANVLAFPLIPLLGVVKTFNLLVIANGVMTGYAMYFYARVRTGDAAAAWIGGLLFGFSPFMSARAAEHFSLTLAAPLADLRLADVPDLFAADMGLACAAGATVAWAFLSDAYYAVYCLLMAGFMACYTMFSVETRPATVRRAWPRTLVDLAIVCLAGLIVGMVLRGGGQVDVFGIRVSFTRLYTPVLVLTLMIGVRVWMTVRPRLVAVLPLLSHAQTAAVGAASPAWRFSRPCCRRPSRRSGSATGSARRSGGGAARRVLTCCRSSRPTPCTRGSGRCRSAGCRRSRAASTRTWPPCPGLRS